jgi:hypothetical protein
MTEPKSATAEDLRMGVTHDSAGNVILNFGSEVSFASFPQPVAIQLAKSILRHAGVKAVEIDGMVTIFPPPEKKEK